MPSRYICEIHFDIVEAIKVLRIDLIPGLCEEARVAGVRMEAKLNDYSNMHYDLERFKELKARIKKLKSTAEFIEANLDLDEVEEGPSLFDRLMDEEDD